MDIGVTDDTNKPTINTETRFRSGKLKLFGTPSSSPNTLTFLTPALTTSYDLSFPTTGLTTSVSNEFVFKETLQEIKYKTIDSATNSVTNLRNSNFASDAVIDWTKINKTGSKLSDLANIDITGRTSGSSIRWDVPSQTWKMFTPSTGLDVALANLTDVVLNTPTLGQVLQWNGNAWTNATSAATSSISKGSVTFDGDGVSKVFQIPHGVTTTPAIGMAWAKSTDAIGAYRTTWDATYITVTYQNPPPSGTGNIQFGWLASDPFGTAGNGIDVTKIVTVNNPNTYGTFNQVIPSTYFKLSNSGFLATFDVGTLISDISLTFPSTSQTIAGSVNTMTMQNKTLTAPIIATIINAGNILTLPSIATNIMGNNTTDTLFNKSMDLVSNNNTITGISDTHISNTAGILWSKISKSGSVIQDIGNVVLTSVTSGQYLQYNGTNWVNVTISGTGETNTASSVGTLGQSIYKQKTGVNFEFNNINIGSTKLSLVNDGSNNVTLDVLPANILLSSLGGTATWTQVSKTGSLLSDFGGTLASTQIATDAVTTTKILNANVTLAKLASASVDASKIVTGSILDAQIGSSAAIAWTKISKTGSALADLANVVLTSLVSGQVLTYNGTNWVNQTPATSSGGGTSVVSNPKWGLVVAPGPTGTNIGSGICVGWRSTALTSGNVTVDSDSDGFYYSLNTTTTSQTNAQIDSNTAINFRGDLNPKIEMKVKFPNVANNRWCMVFTDTIALAENTFNFLNSKNGFGLRFDTSNSGETTWQMINNNGGSTQLVTDSTITPINNTVYLITIQYNNTIGNISVTVNGVTKTTSTQIPATSTEMGFVARMQTTTPAIRNMFIYYINVTQDK